MSTSNESDQNLLEFARQVAAIPKRIAADDGASSNAPVATVTVTPAEVSALPIPGNELAETPANQPPAVTTEQSAIEAARTAKKLCTPEALASLILETLRQVGDLPHRGFFITVYGSNPWNALLTVKPEAGPLIDRTLWISRVQNIVGRLRNEFDIADENSLS